MTAVENEVEHSTSVSEQGDSLSTHSRSDTEDESVYKSDDFSGVRGSDRELLREEEEREKLLSTGKHDGGRSGVLGTPSHSEREVRRKLRRSKKSRAREKARSDEKSKLMYKMEEGGLKDDGSSQSSSSSLDLDRMKPEQPTSQVGDG